MPISAFLGLETALRGLLAEQRALDVTGLNIANANTVGYSRQQAVLDATQPYTDAPAGQIGTGVDVTSYQRIRDAFVDVQLRAQCWQQGAAEARSDGLAQVEDALGEPSDTGLNALLSKYWSSWQDVVNAPDNIATRQALVQDAASLADGFNNLASQLGVVTTQTQQNVVLTVAQVNSLAGRIASLNGEIAAAETGGGTPNDLLDQRDALLDQLSQLAQLSVTPGSGDSVTVSIGADPTGASPNGIVLVDGQNASTLAVTQTGAANAYTIGTSAITFGSAGGTAYLGKLGGLQAVLDQVNDPSSGYLAQLNAVAKGLIDSTNLLHQQGYDLTGALGGTFFDGTDAATIAVTGTVAQDPRHVAAASTAAGVPGDASIALQIADLRTTPLASGSTVDASYSSLVTNIGADAQQANQSAAIAKTLADALENRRQSVSGVSLDEEMANLVRFQRGYQAAARALTAMDDAIDQLINRTGRTGL